MTIPMQSLTAKEITMKGSFRFHPEFRTAVEMMQKKLIDVAPLITGTYPLSDMQTAFDDAGDREQTIKTQIAFAES